MTYINKNIKILIDLCIEIYGNTSYLFKLINDNSFGSIHDIIQVGQVISYDASIVFLTNSVVNTSEIQETPSSIKQIQVRENQSIYDMAIQLYGSIEGVFTLLGDNAYIGSLNNSIVGDKLAYTEQTFSLTQYFKNNNIYITTASNSSRSFDDSFDYSFN